MGSRKHWCWSTTNNLHFNTNILFSFFKYTHFDSISSCNKSTNSTLSMIMASCCAMTLCEVFLFMNINLTVLLVSVVSQTFMLTAFIAPSAYNSSLTFVLREDARLLHNRAALLQPEEQWASVNAPCFQATFLTFTWKLLKNISAQSLFLPWRHNCRLI